MIKFLKKICLFIDKTIFKLIIKIFYSQYKRPRHGCSDNYRFLRKWFFKQKVLGYNRRIPWPVHFTSQVLNHENIEKGICCDPGNNIGVYINAGGGLKLGNNVAIAANSTITTTNHDMRDHRKTSAIKGVVIGDNVWIGANCSIVAGVTIGDNVTIGSGCSIRKSIPSNSIVVSDESNVKIVRKRSYLWDCTKDELI